MPINSETPKGGDAAPKKIYRRSDHPLLDARKTLGLSQRQMAAVLGMKQRALQEIERGKREDPSLVEWTLECLGWGYKANSTESTESSRSVLAKVGPLYPTPEYVYVVDREAKSRLTKILVAVKSDGKRQGVMLSLLRTLKQMEEAFEVEPTPNLCRLYAAALSTGRAIVFRHVYKGALDGFGPNQSIAPNVSRRLRYKGKDQQQADWDSETAEIELAGGPLTPEERSHTRYALYGCLDFLATMPPDYDATQEVAWVLAGQDVRAALDGTCSKGPVEPGFPLDLLARSLVRELLPPQKWRSGIIMTAKTHSPAKLCTRSRFRLSREKNEPITD